MPRVSVASRLAHILRRVTSDSQRPFVVGVIGGGQLARMMDEAATGLGLRLRLLAEGPDTSAARSSTT